MGNFTLGYGFFSLDRVTFSLNPWVYSLRKLIKVSRGKEIMQGRAFPRVSFGKALLSSSQGEEITSGLRRG